MKKISFILLAAVLCASTAAQAGRLPVKIKGKKLPPALKAALRHAQAAQQIREARSLTQLEAAKQAATPRSAKTSVTTPVSKSRKIPISVRAQAYLDKLRQFIDENGYFPRYWVEGESSVAYNLRYFQQKLGPKHPVSQEIADLIFQFRTTRKVPLKRLTEVEEWIEKNGYFPRHRDPQSFSLYQAICFLIQRYPPNDPIVQQIQKLRAFHNRQSKRTPPNWLKELENFVAQNDRYPAPGNTAEENLLYFELDRLIKQSDVKDPISLRINEYRLQYAQERLSPPPDYRYVPEDEDLTYVQEYMKTRRTRGQWPSLSSAQDPQAARHLLAAVLKDATGRLSPADREQLYSLFVNAHPDGHIIPTLVRTYEKNAARYEQVPPALPKAEYLTEKDDNPYSVLWKQPLQQFPSLAAAWDFPVYIYFIQQIYPNRLPTALMKMDVTRSLYNFKTKLGETK